MRMTSDDEILLPPPVSGFSSDECSAEKKTCFIFSDQYSFCQISSVFVRLRTCSVAVTVRIVRFRFIKKMK